MSVRAGRAQGPPARAPMAAAPACSLARAAAEYARRPEHYALPDAWRESFAAWAQSAVLLLDSAEGASAWACAAVPPDLQAVLDKLRRFALVVALVVGCGAPFDDACAEYGARPTPLA